MCLLLQERDERLEEEEKEGGGTHVLRARKRKDLHGEGRDEVGREVNEVDLAPVGHSLERVKVHGDHNYNKVRCEASASDDDKHAQTHRRRRARRSSCAADCRVCGGNRAG